MRELTIEEKAKAYDEAKARMSRAFNSNRCTIGFMNEIFPEFPKNEDEWMRKDCVKYLNLEYLHCSSKEDRIKIEKCVAWLEEHSGNPYSGVSFVYNGNTWGMCARDNGVDISFNSELIQHVSTEKQSENSVCKVKIGETYECVASPKYTCFREGDFYYVDDNFVAELINICSDCFVLLENQGENHIVDNNEMVKPTQNDEDEQNLNEALSYIKDESLKNLIKDRVQLNKKWSEKDEKYFNAIISIIKKNQSLIRLEDWDINWLEALKDRVGYEANCTTKNEWSEEDEKILSNIIKDLVHPWNEYIPDRIEDEIKWLKNKLKSLRPQSTWSPSNEQIVALRWVLNHIPYNKHKEEISGLLDQIKGL